MKKTARILVVDDEPVVLQAYSQTLRAAGYEVWEVSTGQQGLQVTRERRPDLVLLDVLLPDLSGIDVCRQIKADVALLDVFVVLISGTAISTAVKVDGLETGADDYIVKSLNPDEFLARIRTILRLRNTTAALRAKEQLLRQLTENITEVFWITNLGKTQMIYISPGYEKVWGRTCESLYRSPHTWLEAIHPQDHDRVSQAALTKQITGEYDEEYRILRPDGSLRWIRDRAFPIRDETGTAYRIAGIAEDITQHKLAEEKLNQLSVALEQSPASIVITDPAGNIEYVNRKFVELTGYALAEVLGRNPRILQSGQTSQETYQGLWQTITAGKEWRGEFHNKKKNGELYWASASISPIRDLAGRIAHFVAVQEDVTARKSAAEELRESEERFRALFESAPIAIALHDASGHYIHTNRVYQQMLGCSEAELKQLGVKRVTFAEDVAEGQRLFGELCDGTRDAYQRKKRFLSKDGRLIWAEASASVVRDHLGRLRFIISMVEDITERKQAEDQIALLVNSVHSTHELICITDHENRFQFVNRAFLKAYGYSEQELLGRQPDFLYAAPNPPGLCEQVYQQTLGGGWQGEIINRRKDGTEFPIALNTSQIKDGAGRILGLVGVARDISEQKWAEKLNRALSVLGHRLSAATTPEQAASIILEIAAELFGWDAGQLHLYSQTEEKIIPVLTMDTVDGQRLAIQPARPSCDPTPLQQLILKKGAKLINRVKDAADPVELATFGDLARRSSSMMYVPIHSSEDVLGILSIQSYTPLKYTEGDLHLLQILADHCGAAFQRIKIAEALHAAEANYHRIFEKSPEGIVRTTPEGRYCSANPAAARMLGYATPAVLMASVTDIGRQTYVHPEQREELKRLLARQGFVEGFEVERYRKDGSKLWMNLIGQVVRDASGAILYYEGTQQDITVRKQAEAEARQLPQRIIEAQEAERLRVARELHDGVNQLLASAKMRLRNVEENLSEISPAASEVLKRCTRLLVQALEENRRIAHDLRPSDLDELGLVAACRNLCTEFQSRTTVVVRSRFQRKWPQQPPMVKLNLFRIVQEALTNVEKHAHAKTVWLRLAVEGDFAVLRIRDDGRGFDPNASTTAKKKRRGIGLTNLRERVASVGGTYEVLSVPKQGTTIIVRVPYSKAK